MADEAIVCCGRSSIIGRSTKTSIHVIFFSFAGETRSACDRRDRSLTATTTRRPRLYKIRRRQLISQNSHSIKVQSRRSAAAAEFAPGQAAAPAPAENRCDDNEVLVLSIFCYFSWISNCLLSICLPARRRRRRWSLVWAHRGRTVTALPPSPTSLCVSQSAGPFE